MKRQPYHDRIPIDPGLTVIEASAGTGKTHQITNLVVRLIAEKGMAVREIVVVTFTRAATAELRDRIRTRIQVVAAALELTTETQPDTATASLLATAGEQRVNWAARLRAAIRDFDQMSISTIHGFCQRMLTTHAFASETDLDRELIPDTGALIDSLVDDYLDRSLNDVDASQYQLLVHQAGFNRANLAKLARIATDDPAMRIEPAMTEVSEQAYRQQAADLAKRWQGPEGTAIQTQLHQSQHLFRSRSRKYKPAQIDKAIDEIRAWLISGGNPTKPPPGALETCDPKNMTAQLIDVENAIVYSAPSHALLLQSQAFGRHHRLRATLPRVRFAHWVRKAMMERCATMRLQTYADQLRDLSATLSDPNTRRARALIRAVGSTYRAALIDEFQDTDAVQWHIFRTLFGPWTGKGNDPRPGPGHHLFLIGDPKQAIYSFRGANLNVYLDAVGEAETKTPPFALATNWRSDPRLIAALDHRLGNRPALFGDARIQFTSVDAARPNRLESPPSPADSDLLAALDVRFIDGTFDASRASGKGPPLSKSTVLRLLPDRVAADIVELLESGMRINDRRIKPSDMAVLVRGHAQAQQIEWALQRVGVPAVRYGAGNVFLSTTADEVLSWLRAVAAPHRAGLAKIAVSTSLFGWTAKEFEAIDKDESLGWSLWGEWLGQLIQWREMASADGIWSALSEAMHAHRIRSRLLGLPNGERRVANLLHLAELLHTVQTQERMGVAGLVQWMEKQRSDDNVESNDTEIRLDRDDDAVTIRTVHTSKGLQYPIVFAPYMWTGGGVRVSEITMLRVSDPLNPTGRILDLHLDNEVPEKAARLECAERETREEALRLAYVALTRAEQKCVVYIGHIAGIEKSAAAAIWHGDGTPKGNDRLDWSAAHVQQHTNSRAKPDDDGAMEMWSELAAWRDRLPKSDPPLIRLIRTTPVEEPRPWQKPSPDAAPLNHRVWGLRRAGIDRVWGRHSYSRLAGMLRGGEHHTTSPNVEGIDHDQAVQTNPDQTSKHEGLPVPLSEFPAGADAGTCLHAIFEHIEFQDHGEDQRPAIIHEQLNRHGFPASRWGDTVTQAIQGVLHTPLGGALTDFRLADIPRADRLDEMRFDLPIAGGDRHRHGQIPRCLGTQIVDAIRRDDGIDIAYVESLNGLRASAMSGFLNGAIDLVFKAPTLGGGSRWFVADYKSNRIAPRQQKLVPQSVYDHTGILQQMSSHHYLLQLYLYTLALHRLLKQRLEGYEYEQHMGGGLYLFFRGMVGAPVNVQPGTFGVFHHRPSAASIFALDRALSGQTDDA